jgi:hypothetical protein
MNQYMDVLSHFLPLRKCLFCVEIETFTMTNVTEHGEKEVGLVMVAALSVSTMVAGTLTKCSCNVRSLRVTRCDETLILQQCAYLVNGDVCRQCTRVK